MKSDDSSTILVANANSRNRVSFFSRNWAADGNVVPRGFIDSIAFHPMQLITTPEPDSSARFMKNTTRARELACRIAYEKPESFSVKWMCYIFLVLPGFVHSRSSNLFFFFFFSSSFFLCFFFLLFHQSARAPCVSRRRSSRNAATRNSSTVTRACTRASCPLLQVKTIQIDASRISSRNSILLRWIVDRILQFCLSWRDNFAA